MTTPAGDPRSPAEPTAELLDRLLASCTFPPAGTPAACAFSGGPDSTALVALATRHGCQVTAHHVDHRLRPESASEAERAAEIADRLGVPFVLHEVDVEPGGNLEARARDARRRALPPGAMTGHTADDQAETIVLRLLRGSGPAGLGAMRRGPVHPILALRRADARAVCDALGIDAVRDPSNATQAAWRNRVRHELLPLATDIAGRDLVPLLVRTAGLLRDDDDFLSEVAASIDPTDARAVAAAPTVVARRAIRTWLCEAGYPPDAAAVERVLGVARGEAVACELPGGRRVTRSGQRFRIVEPER